ncbi:MAG TPA: DUF2997 domain-containing protein [Planctomycetaceae bacterium]
MTARTIEITISPAGASLIETRGFAGNSCRDASRLIERALGRVADEQLTAEFYAANATEERERLQE